MFKVLRHLQGPIQILGGNVTDTDTLPNMSDERYSLLPVPMLHSILAALPRQARCQIG